MLRNLTVLLLILAMIAYGFWLWKNPPTKGVAQTNTVSDQIAEAVAGNALRAKTSSERVIGDVQHQREKQLQDLEAFGEP